MKERLLPWKKRAERPADPLDLLHREVDELFGNFLGAGFPARRSAGGFELSESDDDIRVRVDLPGVDKEDVEILLEGDMLTIRAERKREKQTRRRNYHISEMSYGNYSRTVQLPAEVDKEKAKARFKRGVLTLVLPKTERAKASRRQIPVGVD